MGQLCSGPSKFVPDNAEKVSTVYSPASKKRDSNSSEISGVAEESNGDVNDEQSCESTNKEIFIDDIEVLPLSMEQEQLLTIPNSCLVDDVARFRIKLVPHVHTAFCERKERVCGSVGKTQQGETLVVRGIRLPLQGTCWLRSSPTDFSTFQCIDGSINCEKYVLTEEDIDCCIAFQHSYYETTVDSSSNNKDEESAAVNCTQDGNSASEDSAKETQPVDINLSKQLRVIRTNIAGPVTPGPPRILSLRITGTMKCGDFAIAAAEYIGGKQGASEYWWYQIKDGKRHQLTKPTKIKNAAALDISSEIDPRVYRITENDVGCVLKVKCRPYRTDGYAGEVFTSKPSTTILAKENMQT